MDEAGWIIDRKATLPRVDKKPLRPADAELINGSDRESEWPDDSLPRSCDILIVGRRLVSVALNGSILTPERTRRGVFPKETSAFFNGNENPSAHAGKTQSKTSAFRKPIVEIARGLCSIAEKNNSLSMRRILSVRSVASFLCWRIGKKKVKPF
jgi:hypothetical protein